MTARKRIHLKLRAKCVYKPLCTQNANMCILSTQCKTLQMYKTLCTQNAHIRLRSVYFSITMEKRKRFCTYTKTNESE